MPQIATVVDDYIAMWNETAPERRRAIIAGTWADAGHLDPVMSGEGPAAASASPGSSPTD